MAQQEIRSGQILDLSIVNADVSPSAAISESKSAFASSGGHDHDLVGTPNAAVLMVRQLRPTQSSTPDLRVQVAASGGVNVSGGVTPVTSVQSVNFSSILPAPGLQRIDLVYLDDAGLVQLRLGTPVSSGPVPPTHDGTLPVAHIGPLQSSTTAITNSLIRDVRPFIASGNKIHIKEAGVDRGYVSTLDLGSNLSVAVTGGVASINGNASGSTVVDASTTVKGIVKLSTAPAVPTEPIAVANSDPRMDLASNSIQKDGSVAFTGPQSFGGNNVTGVGNVAINGAVNFSGTGTISTAAGGDINLNPSGKVKVNSASALQLPNVTGTPPNPNVGDVWYSVAEDDFRARGVSGIKSLAATQTGVLGLALDSVYDDLSLPPTRSRLGNVATIDFPKAVTNSSVVFSFQIPEDAVLLDDVVIRMNYCMSTANAGNVRMNWTYTQTTLNTSLSGSPVSADFTVTPSASASVYERDETMVIPANSLVQRANVAVKLTRKAPDGSDTHTGSFRLISIVVLYAKKDIASGRNVINVIDEVTDLGQVSAVKFTGNLVTATTLSAGVATVTVNDPTGIKATDSVSGTARLNVPAADSFNPIVVGANSTFLPSQPQKDALAGTSGVPSGSNRYVTDSDPRFVTFTADTVSALSGTAGTPNNSNRFVTSTDTRIPTQDENDALQGVGGAPTGSNRYVTAGSTALMSSAQQLAAVGSSGVLSGSNRYVTEADVRILTTDQGAALVGTAGTPNSSNKFVTNSDTRVAALTSDVVAALAGSSGAPATGNRYVTQADAGVMSSGVQGAVQGTFGAPGVSNRFVTANDSSYVIVNGGRSFTGPQAGVDPTLPAHLCTKNYTDTLYNSFLAAAAGFFGPAVQDILNLRAVAPIDRVDKQVRLVEDLGIFYRFDINASGGGEAPNNGPGQWFPIEPDASLSSKGLTRLSVAPASPTAPIAVGDNDGRVPSQGENDALVGTNGTPSTSNPYVTDTDARNTDVRYGKLLCAPTGNILNSGTVSGSYRCKSMNTLGMLNSTAVVGDTFYFDILYMIIPNSGFTTREIVFATDETGFPGPIVRISETIPTTSATLFVMRWVFNLCVLATTGSNNILVQGYNISGPGFINHYSPSFFTLNLASSSFDLQIGMSNANIGDGSVTAYISSWRGRY